MREIKAIEGHEYYRYLCALATSGGLSAEERAEWESHHSSCEACQTEFAEYALLYREGMPELAADDASTRRVSEESVRATRRKLFARVAESVRATDRHKGPLATLSGVPALRWGLAGSLAACLVLAVALGAYRAGKIAESQAQGPDLSTETRYLRLVDEKQLVESRLNTDERKLESLEVESAKKEAELSKLRAESQANEEHTSQAAALQIAELRSITQERDGLSKRLADAGRELETIESQLGALQAERDQATLRSASLRKEVDDLLAENSDKDRQLGKQVEFLSADRDIREIMGARQLYIADVSEVSSDSRLRKPYGRVFYTKGKSLIFYAFDLDRQPGLQKASTFEVWGRNELAEDRPVKLGVLFVDSEANRRWALRCDDPAQLAQIDSIFVTVEPNANGKKPTGKPFLYASLRKEPNHP